MTPFAEWFDAELRRRGISRSQAAAFIGTRPQTISAWFTHDAIPSPALCRSIAEWAHVPAESVMQLAGHLPPAGETAPLAQAPEYTEAQRIVDILRSDPAKLRLWLDMGHALTAVVGQ